MSRRSFRLLLRALKPKHSLWGPNVSFTYQWTVKPKRRKHLTLAHDAGDVIRVTLTAGDIEAMCEQLNRTMPYPALVPTDPKETP